MGIHEIRDKKRSSRETDGSVHDFIRSGNNRTHYQRSIILSKRRSAERIKAIDNFIKENYPTHGADFCAQQLRESAQYVRRRAGRHGIIKLKWVRSRHDMEQRIEHLVSLNKELRLENMKLIAERMEFKKSCRLLDYDFREYLENTVSDKKESERLRDNYKRFEEKGVIL
jgi:hypothetical protein